MHEEILKQFFLGDADVDQLALNLQGSMLKTQATTAYPIVDMKDSFEVKPEHLVKVCEAVINGKIELEALQAIGFCIVASDNFDYDPDTPEGNLVSETVLDWSAPQINYSLTIGNVRKFMARLITGRDSFSN